MPMSSPLTSRREFLTKVGLAGGSAALYETMTALGLINVPKAWAGPLKLPAGSGEGQSVVILGAGIGGLTAAYELTKAGYSCQILEAQDRAGGRSLTARRGTKIIEQSFLHNRTEQECQFDEGLYLNMGPGRIPYHHRRVIHYCQELNVPLEIYVMETTANLFQSQGAFDGESVSNGRIANDVRGHISDLLAKAIDQPTLDIPLNQDDRDKLRDLLRVFGDLKKIEGTDRYEYRGSSRAGCSNQVTVEDACTPFEMLELRSLLQSDFWKRHFYDPVHYLWQSTLFQPVGGMDRIVQGFERSLPTNLILKGAEVRDIVISDDQVEVRYRSTGAGTPLAITADYCISTIPLHFFMDRRPKVPGLDVITANFANDFRDAIAQSSFAAACKVGWQANQRFWESTENRIYGGISWTDDIIEQIWYPSNDYLSGNAGTLTGAYIHDFFDPERPLDLNTQYARIFGEMTLAERLEVARRGAVKMHPEFADTNIVPEQMGLSIAWQNVAFQHGAWAQWDSKNQQQNKAYKRLLSPDRRFHVVGDQVSKLPGWQEGAMMSAEHACGQIAGKIPLDVSSSVLAPTTRELVQGLN